MSYKQIIRRVNRVVKSKINEVIEKLSPQEELREFDELLKKAAEELKRKQAGTKSERGSSAGSTGTSQQRKTSGYSSSGQQSQQQQYRQQQSRQQEGAPSSGKRKPGEKDDAFYLSVLGLTPMATDAAIKATYRKLMAKYHPDRTANLDATSQRNATEKAKAITEAYGILSRRKGFK